MDTATIKFEDLQSYYEKEKADTIQEVPQDLYERIKKLLNEMDLTRRSTRDYKEYDLLSDQVRSARDMATALLNFREQKIFDLALISGANGQLQKMTPEEKTLYNELEHVLKNHRVLLE